MTEKSNEDAELNDAQLTEESRLAKIFIKLWDDLRALDNAYLDEGYPVNARVLRSYAIRAIDSFRSALNSAFFENEKDRYILTPALEALSVELSEVNAGRRSPLFLPNPGETNRIKTTIRAVSAAALHFFIEEGLLSLEEAASLISDELFKASISRVHTDTKEKSPIPPSTIMDWRQSREAHSTEFVKLFERFAASFFLVAALQKDDDAKRQAVRNLLIYLIRLFNYS